MAKELKVYDELLQRIYRASDIDKVLEVLDELQYFQQSGVLSLKERFHLQVDAFRRLQQSTVDNPDVAQVVILGYLLPQCLLTNSDVSIELHGHRECLVDWLNQYPGDIQRELRRKVLENIYSHIETSDPRAACWVIERIGYRTDRIVDTLWQIVEQHNDELGDTAIRTLTSLGAPSKERARFISELHRRVAERYNHSLAFALAQLSDPTSIKVLEEHWLNLDGPVEKPIDLGIVVNVLISVLNAEVDEEDLQDNVWQWLTGLADEKPDEFYHIFYLGRVVPNCNSTLVVPKMLELLAEETEDKKNPTWGHYLIGLRLEECVRPRQLDGWSCINNPEVIELLRQDACRDTEQDLFTTSQEDMVKEMAWKTVLRAGHLNALKWFNQAVAPETGRFLQKTIIEMFAHFRFKSLPEIIKLWITDRLDNSSFEKDSRELSRRMAAVRMARSSSTREAFDVLRTFGFTFQGKPLKQSTDALAEVAHHLVGKGDVSVIDELVEVVVEGSEEHQRVAAAYSLERLASVKEYAPLIEQHIERIIPTLHDLDRPLYERGTLIKTLGHLTGWHAPDEFLKDLKVWAREPERWLGGSSLFVLVMQGHLHKDHYLLEKVLGLRKIGETWDLVPEINSFEWAPYYIGLLYNHYPELFYPAVVSGLKNFDWSLAVQIINWLQQTYITPDQSLPLLIRKALINRIHERYTGYGEIGLFPVLVTLAPEDLANEKWVDQWEHWLPDSRVALANALGEVNLEPSTDSNALSSLQLLAGDGLFKVRRAAYRSIARQSMTSLLRLCLSRSDPNTATPELRQRAAEACGWLVGVKMENGSDAFDILYQQLVTDPEKTVREAVKRTREERRQRIWAEQYLAVIMKVEGDNNEEILNAWRYGDILARIGDDSCIDALRRHLSTVSGPPNLRYWIQQLIEQMQENWRKTSQKWPEPWFVWKGQIQEGQGKVYFERAATLDINYSIWQQAPSVPTDVWSWGGAVWPMEIHLEEDPAKIELEDGRQGKILFVRYGEIGIFQGSGHYPS